MIFVRTEGYNKSLYTGGKYHPKYQEIIFTGVTILTKLSNYPAIKTILESVQYDK